MENNQKMDFWIVELKEQLMWNDIKYVFNIICCINSSIPFLLGLFAVYHSFLMFTSCYIKSILLDPLPESFLPFVFHWFLHVHQYNWYGIRYSLLMLSIILWCINWIFLWLRSTPSGTLRFWNSFPMSPSCYIQSIPLDM